MINEKTQNKEENKMKNELKLQLHIAEIQEIVDTLEKEIKECERHGKTQARKYFLIDLLKKVNNTIEGNG